MFGITKEEYIYDVTDEVNYTIGRNSIYLGDNNDINNMYKKKVRLNPVFPQREEELPWDDHGYVGPYHVINDRSNANYDYSPSRSQDYREPTVRVFNAEPEYTVVSDNHVVRSSNARPISSNARVRTNNAQNRTSNARVRTRNNQSYDYGYNVSDNNSNVEVTVTKIDSEVCSNNVVYAVDYYNNRGDEPRVRTNAIPTYVEATDVDIALGSTMVQYVGNQYDGGASIEDIVNTGIDREIVKCIVQNKLGRNSIIKGW